MRPKCAKRVTNIRRWYILRDGSGDGSQDEWAVVSHRPSLSDWYVRHWDQLCCLRAFEQCDHLTRRCMAENGSPSIRLDVVSDDGVLFIQGEKDNFRVGDGSQLYAPFVVGVEHTHSA